MAELDQVLRQAPVKACCVHAFIQLKAFIFRDRWSVYRRYDTDLNDLKKALNAKVNPFPAGLDDPLPALIP